MAQLPRAELADLYGSLSDTMFSLMLSISGGMDWWDVAKPIVQINDWYKYVFAFYVQDLATHHAVHQLFLELVVVGVLRCRLGSPLRSRSARSAPP